MDGWIKLHREIINHWIYQDAEYLKVWVEMLVRARYWDEPGRELVGDQIIMVGRGEFIFGRPAWSRRLGISEQRLKTLIQKMIKDDMIELIQKYSRCTLYRVKNYEKFNQQDNQQDNQPEDQSCQDIERIGNQHTNQQMNQRSTSSQPAANQQPTNNKESKERKNDKKEKKKDNTAFEDYTSNPVLLESLNSFYEYRKKSKKPMTDAAVKLLLKKLDDLASDDDTKIDILNQSILNGWQGVFPIKDDLKNRRVNKPEIVKRETEQEVSEEEFAELVRMAEERKARKEGVIR
ncbi:hypothetical protein [Paenibacillus senegalimassiliensis]|uniref:hypothetical protein n=1 Tax=Paenibacillus senegalimassiliensis TaxID=1737426 RepID=UPI00073EE3DA|nr:hypothetical protein [Paenibacillus senegalimassiliensis]